MTRDRSVCQMHACCKGRYSATTAAASAISTAKKKHAFSSQNDLIPEGSRYAVKHELYQLFVCIGKADSPLSVRNDTVRQHRNGDGFNIVGYNIVATVDGSRSARRRKKRKRAARTDAETDALALACGGNDRKEYNLSPRHRCAPLYRLGSRIYIGSGSYGSQRGKRRHRAAVDIHHPALAVGGGIAERQLHKETVALRLGKREGAERFNGVLRCDNKKTDAPWDM